MNKRKRKTGKAKAPQEALLFSHEKLSYEALSGALGKSAGSIDLKSYPEWKTPENVSRWVESIRGADDSSEKKPLSFQETRQIAYEDRRKAK